MGRGGRGSCETGEMVVGLVGMVGVVFNGSGVWDGGVKGERV